MRSVESRQVRRARERTTKKAGDLIDFKTFKKAIKFQAKFSPEENERVSNQLIAKYGNAPDPVAMAKGNRQLAKMACKAGKPDGNMIWHPNDMPGPAIRHMAGPGLCSAFLC